MTESTSIKSLVPDWIKFPFWYIVKAPQRVFGLSTLWRDLQTIVLFGYRKIFPVKKLKPVTICTGLYNRSNNYLNYTIGSLNKAKHQNLIELSVFDCGSNDIPNLQAAIKERWNGRLTFVQEQVKFARSYTFNHAIEQAQTDIVFICDADISVPEDIVTLCNQFTGPRRVWYPIVFFLFKNKPALTRKGNGDWLVYEGKGMFACRKQDFKAIGRLDESFTEWGPEDRELWERWHKGGYFVIRNKQKGLMHHWHNTLSEKYRYMND